MHTLAKEILVDFQLEKYMQFKKMYIFIFFLQNQSDVTKWGTVYSHQIKNLYVVVISTPTVIACLVFVALNRGSYMSAHVLLNLLNELGKRDKMRGLPSILSLFRNDFNEFNNT